MVGWDREIRALNQKGVPEGRVVWLGPPSRHPWEWPWPWAKTHQSRCQGHKNLDNRALCFLIYFNWRLITVLWWFLPYIHMNQPWVYMCSPSWLSLPPPSPSHPLGSSQCSSPTGLSAVSLYWCQMFRNLTPFLGFVLFTVPSQHPAMSVFAGSLSREWVAGVVPPPRRELEFHPLNSLPSFLAAGTPKCFLRQAL